MTTFEQQLQRRLEQRHDDQSFRQRRLREGPSGPTMVLDGRPMLSFASNDYLGLAAHPHLIASLSAAAEEYGVGSGASHLISGYCRAHRDLEQRLAEFTGRERALLFANGTLANAGVISALLDRGDLLVADRLNHASLLDAARLSRARLKRYPHGDADAVPALLDGDRYRRQLIVSDGVFSMDGDLAPVQRLAAVADDRGALLMIDDAHGFGVLGQRGAGTLELTGSDTAQVPLLMATLGKAVGAYGAFVAGSQALIETLVQSARSYIYTTALPPALASAAATGLGLLQTESWRREKLLANIQHFRRGARQLDLPVADSDTPIQPLVLGSNERALRVSAGLQQAGLYVPAIRPPTVPANTARLRITFSCEHGVDDIDRLLDALSGLLR